MLKSILAASVVVGLSTTAAMAADRAMAVTPADGPAGSETVTIDIVTSDGPLWSGTLTLGPQYGNAHFSQSKSEAAPPCASERRTGHGNNNVSSSLNFNISRANWQQQPNSFNVNFSRTTALSACEGHGNNTFGFNRTVEIEPGMATTIEGPSGDKVTIRRGR